MDQYKYQVNFEKVFLSGILKGRRYTNAYLRFPDIASASAFASECDGKTVAKASDGTNASYVREYPIITELEV